MKAALSLLIALIVAGCAARYQVNSGGPPPSAPPAGGAVQIQSGASGVTTAAALLVIGILAGSSEASRAREPELAADRRVNEQDCTKPIADPSANLKCR